MEEVTSKVYDKDGNSKEITIEGSEIVWIEEWLYGFLQKENIC